MKVVPIADAGAQINQLALDALKGELVVLTVGSQEIELRPRETEVEEYDSELETELLKGLEGTATPYVPGEFERMVKEMARDRKKR